MRGDGSNVPKLYIKTYGCQMNVHDSEHIANIMTTVCNMELTKNPIDADLLILNTCSVRAKASDKLFSDLGRLRELKKDKPNWIIGVGGCVAAHEGKKILQRASCVNFVFGPQTLHRLPFLYEQATKHKRCIDIENVAQEKFAALPPLKVEGKSAFVTIMEGCNKYCSYCIVPYTRGQEISRSLTDVLSECNLLVAQGVKEITFLGQNVNDYKGQITDGKYADLAELLHKTAIIEGVERISFTTSYPSSFTENLIKAYATIPQLVNTLHLPVQSGSDRILQAMRRRYTVAEFKERIAKLREVRPSISISSDFIVGFPGETDEDFQATLDLVKEINFDKSFSFIYSPRPGTLAAKLKNDVPHIVKKQRLAILQQQLNMQAVKFSEAMLGTVQKVLVTGCARRGGKQLTGRTENNRIVNFNADNSFIGKIVMVEITEVLTNCLRGRFCGIK